MPLVTLNEILPQARKNHSAIGAFTIWNLESIHAAIAGAENLKQPIILQVGPGEGDYANLDDLALLAIHSANKATVPVSLHLDHGDSFERTIKYIQQGFPSVMLDASHLPYEQNVAQTREVVHAAHACGVTVEGELGCIGGSEAGKNIDLKSTAFTDPDQAADFVEKTGIDALAIGIGTVHGFYKSKPEIKLDLLEKIAKKVSIPLVLHGGSGTPDQTVKKAIQLGISKINVCTDFVAAFIDSFATQQAKGDFQYNVNGAFTKPRRDAQKLVEAKIKVFANMPTS